MPSNVCHYHSGMANGPVLNGTQGAMIALLDACLIHGFDTRSINSIVVSGGVATATISAGHTYELHAVVRIAVSTPAGLNGDFRITSAGPSTFTFACPGVPDGSATGTLTAKRAPAGWEKVFSGANKAVYRSGALDSTRLLLRVNDADARFVRVRGYENMSDVDTGTGLFPALSQLAETAMTWTKSAAADSTPRDWTLVADDRMFYLAPAFVAAGNPRASIYRFGDLVSLIDGDAYGCGIAGHEIASPVTVQGSIGTFLGTTNGTGCYLARAASQAGTAMAHGHAGLTTSAGSGSTTAITAVDGRWHLSSLWAIEGTGDAPLRGLLPGYYLAREQQASTNRSIVEVDGKTLMLVQVGYSSAPTDNRFVAFDILGPWR